MTRKHIKTRIKLFPAILKLLLGAAGIVTLTTAVSFTIKILTEPTAFNVVSVLMFSFIGFFFIGIGPATVSAYSIDDQTLTESILGVIKRHTDLTEIQSYSLRQGGNRYRTSDLLILNKKNGQTIFIDSFGQKNFKAFRLEIAKLLPYDFNAKPNYWTKFYRVSVISLCIWFALMLGFIITGR